MNTSTFNIILLALATGAPGATRLLAIFLAENEMTPEILGGVLSDLAIANILSYLTCIGFGSVLIPRLAKLERSADQLGTLSGVMISALPIWIACVAVVFILARFQLVLSIEFVLIFLLGFGVYQYIRHFYVALSSYRNLLVLEFLILLITLAVYRYGEVIDINYSGLFSIPFLVVAIFFVMSVIAGLLKKQTIYISQKGAFIHGLRFGLTNMFSGGVFMMMVPIVRFYEGSAYAALMGTTSAISNMLMLITRPLSNYYLPDMARNHKNRKKINEIFKTMGLIIVAAVSLFLLAFVLGFGLLETLFSSVFSIEFSFILSILAVIMVALGQFFLPHNCWLVVHERSAFSLRINLAFFVTFVVLAFIIGEASMNGANKIMAILAAVCVMQLLKGAILVLSVRRFRAVAEYVGV